MLFLLQKFNRLLLMMPLLVSVNAFATDDINTENNVALHGYDPVSYFTDLPKLGDKKNFIEYKNANYQFSSISNKNQFTENPKKYLPMYGGYCAYGVRMGKKLDADPLSYKIKDGRLYMLLNRATQKIWEQDMNNNIHISNRLWPEIKDKPTLSLQ